MNYLLQISVDSQLEQVNLEPTRGKNILELLFTSNPETISSCKTGPGISDHDSILIAKCRLRTAQNKKKPRTINLFQKTDWGAMKSAITMESVTFFETSPGSRTTENNWQIYKKTVLDTIAKLVPQKTISGRYKPPWITREVKRLIRKKDRAYKRAKKTNRGALEPSKTMR